MPLQSLLICVTKAEFVLTINQYKIKQTSDKNKETYQLEIISWSSVKFSELTPQELYGNINKNYLICDILRVKGLRPLTTSQNNKHAMNWWNLLINNFFISFTFLEHQYLISMSMATNDYWLHPAGNQPWNVFANYCFSEDSSTKNVSNCPIRRFPHFLQIKLWKSNYQQDECHLLSIEFTLMK